METIEIIAGTCVLIALGFSFVDLRRRPNYFELDDLLHSTAWGGWLAWFVAALGTITFLSLEIIENWGASAELAGALVEVLRAHGAG